MQRLKFLLFYGRTGKRLRSLVGEGDRDPPKRNKSFSRCYLEKYGKEISGRRRLTEERKPG